MPAYFFSGISHEFQKCYYFFENYLFFICIRFDDFLWRMNNKRMIEFGFRRISELFRPRSALSDLGLNNSEYPAAQPHPIILNNNNS